MKRVHWIVSLLICIAAGPATGPSRTVLEGLSFDLPADWKIREGEPMRLATLTSAGGVEISVSGFGGKAGGALANINRWRKQLKLAEITEAELSKYTELLKAPAGDFTVVDFSGGEPVQRMVAVIAPAKDRTYFFKMMGPADRIGPEREGLIGLVKSVKFEE